MSVSATAAWAGAYAAVGWRTFPLEGKVPLAGFLWQDWGTTDPGTLCRWLGNESRNVGAVTGERAAGVPRGRRRVEIERADRALGGDADGLGLGIDRKNAREPGDREGDRQNSHSQKPHSARVGHAGWTATRRSA